MTAIARPSEVLESRLLLSAAHDLIGITALRNDPVFAGIDGTGGTVVVIDTGVDITHPLLAPNYVFDPDTQEPIGADLIFGGSNPRPVGDHGTHVAGIIGASDPEIGVAPGVGLIGLQVFVPSPSGRLGAPDPAIEKALQWVADHQHEYNIVAVNMSLGGGFFLTPSEAAQHPFADEIRLLEQQGVSVVSAAGNSYADLAHAVRLQDGEAADLNRTGSPGILSTFNVGAVYEGDPEDRGHASLTSGTILSVDRTAAADQLTVFSQRPQPGQSFTIFAPGATIDSTVPISAEVPGGIEGKNGTSMAAPMVSGAVAVLQQVAQQFGGERLPVDVLRQIVTDTADVVVDNSTSTVFVSRLAGDPAANGQLHPLPLTGQSFRRINVHRAAQAVVQLFQDRDDANGTLATASPGRSLFVSESNRGALSPIGRRRQQDSQRPLVGHVGLDGDRVVGPQDVDVYELNLLSSGALVLQTSAVAGEAAQADTFLRLFDADGNELGADDNSAGSGFSRLEIPVLNAGRYFAAVSGSPNRNYDPNSLEDRTLGDTGHYQLTFELTAADSNGTLATATDLGILATGTTSITSGLGRTETSRRRDLLDVVDLFRVEVTETGKVRMDVDTFHGSGIRRNALHNLRTGAYFPVNPADDLYLRLFDHSGRQLAFNDDGLAPAEADAAGNAEVTWQRYPGYVFTRPEPPPFWAGRLATAHGRARDPYLEIDLPRGVYYVGLSSAVDSGYDPQSFAGRGDASLSIEYDLTLGFQPHDLDGSLARAAALPVLEPGQPQVLTAEVGRDADAVVAVDTDMWRVIPAASGLLDLQIDTSSAAGILPGRGVAAVLSVYDRQGQLLGTTAAGGVGADGADPGLQLPIEAGQEVFVAVSGRGGSGFDPTVPGSGTAGETGQYQLTLRLGEARELAGVVNDTVRAGRIPEFSVGEFLGGSIGMDDSVVRAADDVDLYYLVVPETGRIQLQTLSAERFAADTRLRVFRQVAGTWTEIASGVRAAARLRGSSVVVDAVAGERLLVGVNGASPAGQTYDPVTGSGTAPGSLGDYVLTSTLLAPEPEPEPEPEPVLDLDGSGGTVTAQTDGLLAFAVLAGVTSDSQLANLMSGQATRNAASVMARISALSTQLDVDASGDVRAQSDGLLIFAILAGVTQADQLGGLLGLGATRSVAEVISAVNELRAAGSVAAAGSGASTAAVFADSPLAEALPVTAQGRAVDVAADHPAEAGLLHPRWQDALFASVHDEDEEWSRWLWTR